MSAEHVSFIVALVTGFGSGAAFGSSCALRWARKQQELLLADLRRTRPRVDGDGNLVDENGNVWNGSVTIGSKP